MNWLRALIFAMACAWALAFGVMAWAQAPTLPEVGRRVDELKSIVSDIQRDQSEKVLNNEKRLSTIEAEMRALNDRLAQLNQILTAILGAVVIGGGGLSVNALRNKTQQRKRGDTPVG
jgi:TolA-binding protein